MANFKLCSKCGKVGLDQYDFRTRYHSHNGKYYYTNICKGCESSERKQWVENNCERYREVQRIWRDNNRKYSKEWNKLHPESVKKKSKKYRENHIDKIYNWNAKRRAMKLNQTPELTENEKAKIEMYYKISQYLGKKWHVDHIHPISKGGLHHPDNLQVVTKEYNLQKHNDENFRAPTALEYFKI